MLRSCPSKTTAAASEALDESSSLSNITIPYDYDTDVLRAELTQFGAPPGPIEKTTKRLYMKRLMRFQRNPEIANLAKNIENRNRQKTGDFFCDNYFFLDSFYFFFI